MADRREQAYRAYLKRQFINRPRRSSPRQHIALTFSVMYDRRRARAGEKLTDSNKRWVRWHIETVQHLRVNPDLLYK